MNPQSQSLPRSAFAAFCALALAASMALPLMGASQSYAEEVRASAAEGDQAAPTQVENDANEAVPTVKGTVTEPSSTEGNVTNQSAGKAASYTVTFANDNPITVNAGDSVVAPSRSDSIETSKYGYPKNTATFVGWYCVDPDWASDEKGNFPLDKNGHYVGLTVHSLGLVMKSGIIPQDKLAEFKNERVFFAGGDSVAVDKNMELYALYAYETVLSTGGNYFMGIDEAQPMSSSYVWKGWMLDEHGLGGGEYNAYAHNRHPDFVLKGYYYGKDGKPTNVAVPLNTPINEDTEIWDVFVRNESLPVSGAKGVVVSGTLSGANVPVNAKVSVSVDEVTSGEAYDALAGQLGSSMFGGVFEVALIADGAEVHDGFGELTLSFPVGDENDGYNFAVYHRHQDGSVTSETVEAANGVVTITATDLFSFALVKGEKTSTGDKSAITPFGTSDASQLAQTGDITPTLAFGGFALVALSAAAFAGYRARKAIRK